MNLDYFKNLDDFYTGLQTLFKSLNVPVNYIDEKSLKPQDILSKTYKDTNPSYQLMDDVYILGMVDDAAFDEKKSDNILEIKKSGKDYDGILIFGVTLKERENGLLPSRTLLAEITRAFNREFHYTPVVVVFRYENFISLANAERLKYKQEWREGEKTGKVSILRDIDITNPHTGHLKILEELKITRSGKKGINSFEGLYQYWQEVFSVSLLSKKFYSELSNWYFWAIKHVTFPSESIYADDKNHEYKAQNVIRLLTRLLFVWFIKEKKLIPEALFDLEELQNSILKKIEPEHFLGQKQENRESIYYKAILQNLFFATLNCPVKPDSIDTRERGFRGSESYGKHRGVDYLMRYKQHFKDPDAFLKMVNEVVPFLNGGLFECLDDKENNIYIDGFSDNMTKGNTLIVPDYLFFGREEEADLSSEIGIKNKGTEKAAVKGLINILKSYKFTIAENTPIEEDVALDPELLGKVFENLLASYNPETKTTARKQTGSFYTPREIVNYMVDESLIAHLKNSVSNWKMEEKELDDKLHRLVSFGPANPFENNDELSKAIIHSLDSCKILDPACGSGAFPMGILQKMVHILQKVDPDNKHWQDLQQEKAIKETEGVFVIKGKEEREQLLLEINEAFDETINNPDYARKLFLIENCIYGVDIQPIATQISKLRFFISLVVEQKVNKEKENFGIRPLPNLETKFVTANTLIGIEKPEAQMSLFDTTEVKKLEQELKTIRHKLFGAKTKATKVKYRKRDEELRIEIAEELKKSGWRKRSAAQLASWDPYDQNGVSPFFDPEWMFDIKDGFDVVIGNPPYGAEFSKIDKAYIQKIYYSMEGDFESYIYFIEKAFKIAGDRGILCYITPNNFLMQWFSGKIRELILKRIILQIVDLGFNVFESGVVPTSIIIIQNSLTTNNELKFKSQKDAIFDQNFNKIQQNEFLLMPKNQINLKLTDTNLNIYHLLVEDSFPLENVAEIKIGIECKPEFISDTADTENHKPLVRGRNFERFILDFDSDPKYVLYIRKLLHRPREERLFLANEKILIRQTGDKIIAAMDYNKLYAWKSVFMVLSKDPLFELKYILSLLNSTLLNYFYSLIVGEDGRTFAQVKGVNLNRLPIKKIELKTQKIYSLFANILSTLKEKNNNHTSFERIMNSSIFELYFTDHMKEKQIDVLQFVEKDVAEVMQDKEFDTLRNSQKEHVIAELHKRWSNPNREIVKRMNSFAEKSPDILKPILK